MAYVSKPKVRMLSAAAAGVKHAAHAIQQPAAAPLREASRGFMYHVKGTVTDGSTIEMIKKALDAEVIKTSSGFSIADIARTVTGRL